MHRRSSTEVRRSSVLAAAGMAIVLTALPAGAQFKQLPMEPLHESGQSISPSFEGWWQNPDGTFSVLLGYFNRNTRETPDIPVGPSNHIDPGGPDYGQPTHFLPRRQWGVFAAVLPKDFGKTKKLTWTIVANGLTMSVPFGLDPIMAINPMSEIGIGNTPPTISFDEKGPSVQGPLAIVVSRTAAVGKPLPLTVWAADDDKRLRLPLPSPAGRGAPEAPARAGVPPDSAAPPDDARIAALAAVAGINPASAREFLSRPAVSLTFQKFRGPGEVTFSNPKPVLERIADGTAPVRNKFNGKADSTATFSEPGEYIVRVVANDSSGDGGNGFLCCWTNAEIKVTVK